MLISEGDGSKNSAQRSGKSPLLFNVNMLVSDIEAMASEHYALLDMSQRTESTIAPPSISIPTTFTTDNQIFGLFPLTDPSCTSGSYCTNVVSLRTIAFDCTEKGQSLSVPLTTAIPTITNLTTAKL
jgi:hypothetical protein